MHDSDDKIGMTVLVTKVIRAQDWKTRAAAALKEAQSALAEASEELTQCRKAFVAFGIDVDKAEKPWELVRAAIGDANWFAAFDKAKLSPISSRSSLPPPTAEAEVESETAENNEAGEQENRDDESQQGNTEDDAVAGADSEAEEAETIGSGNESEVPSVREFVLARLEAAGGRGARATDLRREFEQTYGAELHDKTIGMTLYRLSKHRDSRVLRVGRDWFLVKPSGRTENPDAAASGSE